MRSAGDSWSKLSSEERLQRRWAAFSEPEGIPYRVPVCALTGLYPATSRGLAPLDAMHDYPRAAEAWLACRRDLQPDALLAPIFAAIPARAFEALDVKVLSWPGHGVAKTAGFQYNEKEWMPRR